MSARSHASAAAAARGGQRPSAIGLDDRMARAVVVTLVVGGYTTLGLAFGLSAEAYLLLGIPITIAFQMLIVRAPLRALWLRDAPPFAPTIRFVLAVVVVSIAPAAIAIRGATGGDPVLAAYGLVGVVGAIGAVYAMRAMDRDAVRATVRATLTNGAILVGVMVAFRLATGGFHGSLREAIAAAVVSVATYLPIVFVVEEVFFRGLLDPYLHGTDGGRGRASALYGSALWGIWHLPVMSIDLGLLTIPYIVAIHTVMGFVLVTAWRRTGNLAAPGIAHAVANGARNAVAVL